MLFGLLTSSRPLQAGMIASRHAAAVRATVRRRTLQRADARAFVSMMSNRMVTLGLEAKTDGEREAHRKREAEGVDRLAEVLVCATLPRGIAREHVDLGVRPRILGPQLEVARRKRDRHVLRADAAGE